jgi:hypothetical protein
MLSTTSMIIFGVIALIAVVVIWKWWKKPNLYKKNDDLIQYQDQNKDKDKDKEQGQGQRQELKKEQKEQEQTKSMDLTQIPLTVFAINDNGILDLTDMSGKVLNIGFGRHPKTYAILLNYAENDTDKIEQGNTITFISKVGNTKVYDVIQQPYIIDYTRL